MHTECVLRHIVSDECAMSHQVLICFHSCLSLRSYLSWAAGQGRDMLRKGNASSLHSSTYVTIIAFQQAQLFCGDVFRLRIARQGESVDGQDLTCFGLSFPGSLLPPLPCTSWLCSDCDTDNLLLHHHSTCCSVLCIIGSQ